jgi:hypothetical protein
MAALEGKAGLMKKIVISWIVGFALGLLSPRIATAQGTINYVSNLGQPSTGDLAVGSNSWIAAMFYAGGNLGGYMLNSIQLSMVDPSGGPTGFTVMIYSGVDNLGGIVPGSNLGTLTGSSVTGHFKTSQSGSNQNQPL